MLLTLLTDMRNAQTNDALVKAINQQLAQTAIV